MRRAFPSRSNSAATPPVSATTAANTHANRRASTNDAGTVRFNITELNEALPIPQPPAYSPIPRYSAPSQPPPRSNLRQPHNSAGILTTEPIDPRGPTRARSRTEDPLMILQRYDLCFLIDDSPSMISLWNQAREALKSVADIAVKYDRDGIDLFFFNAYEELPNCTSASQVEALFKTVIPDGSTPTAIRLDDILRPYIDDCEDAKANRTQLPKPKVIVVITDGEADDEEGVVDVIVEMAQRLDAARCPPFQLGLQFLQIGSDPDAAAFLRRLDDDLKEQHGCRDICDTRTYSRSRAMSGDWIMKVLLGSINRRIDAQAETDPQT